MYWMLSKNEIYTVTAILCVRSTNCGWQVFIQLLCQNVVSLERIEISTCSIHTYFRLCTKLLCLY